MYRVFVVGEQCGDLPREHLERLYIFALMWSAGALLELEDRKKMELWFRGNDAICPRLPDIPAGREETMFDYYVTADGNRAVEKYPHFDTLTQLVISTSYIH